MLISRLTPYSPITVKRQGSEHDSEFGCHMTNTVSLRGEGVITAIMPSCDGGEDQIDIEYATIPDTARECIDRPASQPLK
jgi:hypothetical protein